MFNNEVYYHLSTNSLSKEKIIKWYSCGPTVYNDSHLGHARNYIMNDVLRRILIHFGYKIDFCMNITDIDDKIINIAKSEKMSFGAIAEKYEKSFFDDMEKLNVLYPNKIIRVTESIPHIIKYIQKIIDNGFAYCVNDSVYFDSLEYEKKFSIQSIDAPSIQDNDFSHEKKNAKDFVLWKKAKDGEPFWDSPFGQGRPGWHIECSAMCNKYFGDHLTIHTGGIDLKFPHHDNEIKQTYAYLNNNKWCEVFLHIGHLNIDGLKMSKSEKNFILIKELLAKYNPNQIRYLFLNHKYDEPMDFSYQRLEQTSNDLKTIMNFLQELKIKMKSNSDQDKNFIFNVIEFENNLNQSLCNEFDIPNLIKKLFENIKIINTNINKINKENLANIYYCINNFLVMLGVNIMRSTDDYETKTLDILVKFRNDIKNKVIENKHFDYLKMTDDLRNIILPNIGVYVEDKKNESIYKIIR